MRPTALILASAGLTAAQTTSSNCTDGLYMIVARATGEQPGTGRVGVVANNVSASIPNSAIQAIVYPATFINYTVSEGVGVTAMTAAIKDRVSACPDGKIALLGFSQGAQVTADTLCGRDDGAATVFSETPELGAEYERNIVAVVMFGDPSHSVNATFNRGNSTRNGVSFELSSSPKKTRTPRKPRSFQNANLACDRSLRGTMSRPASLSQTRCVRGVMPTTSTVIVATALGYMDHISTTRATWPMHRLLS